VDSVPRSIVRARGCLFALLLALPLAFSTATVDSFEYPKLALLQLGALALLALGLPALIQAGAETRRRLAREALREPAVAGVLLFCLSAAASTAASISPRTSFYGANESFSGLTAIVPWALVFFAGWGLAHSAAEVRWLLWAPQIAAALTCLYALVQAAGADPLPWQGRAVFAGYVRPFGTLGHPNLLGAFLAMVVPLAAQQCWAAGGEGRRPAAAAHGLAAALACAAIVLSASRGAWLALAVAGAVLLTMAALAGLSRRALLVLTAASVAGAVIAVALALAAARGPWHGLAERVRHLTEAESRRQIWGVALGILADHPLLGSGVDTFQLAFAPRRPPGYWLSTDWNTTPLKAHDDLLHVLATQGLPGGAAALLLAGGAIAAGIRLWRRGTGPERGLAAALVASLAAFCAQGLVGFTVVATGVLFAAEAGFLCRLASKARAPATPEAAPGKARRAEQDGPALHAALWAAAAAMALVFVVGPLRAQLACQEGVGRLRFDPAGAVAAFRKAVELEPSRDAYWSKLGMAAQQAAQRLAPGERQRHLATAREAYERAVALVPADPLHHMRLARVLADQAAAGFAPRQAALEACDAALSLDPRNAYFCTTAANAALLLGDRERARRYAGQALALYPRFAAPHFQLGNMALAEGRTDEGIRELETAFHGEWHGEEHEGRRLTAQALAAALRGVGRNEEAEGYARYAGGGS
jgi:O-antigen ligase